MRTALTFTCKSGCRPAPRFARKGQSRPHRRSLPRVTLAECHCAWSGPSAANDRQTGRRPAAGRRGRRSRPATRQPEKWPPVQTREGVPAMSAMPSRSLFGHDIAQAAHGLYQVGAEFFAHAVNIDLHRVAADVVFPAEEFFFELSA